MKAQQNFESWMAQVDRELVRICELTSGEMGDYLYWNAFDRGESPADVAIDAFAFNLVCMGIDSESIDELIVELEDAS